MPDKCFVFLASCSMKEGGEIPLYCELEVLHDACYINNCQYLELEYLPDAIVLPPGDEV